MTKNEKRLAMIRKRLKANEHTQKIDWHTDTNHKILKHLKRDAVTLGRLYEAGCNGCTREKLKRETWKEYDQARIGQIDWINKRVAQVENRIAKVCRALDIPFYLQTDPRGCSLYLGSDSDISYDTQGIAIY